MKRLFVPLFVPVAFGLTACDPAEMPWATGAQPTEVIVTGEDTGADAAAEPVETLDPTPPPPPPPTADTVEEFDTTSAEDRAAALAPEPAAATEAGPTDLGTTLATLGSPADPGIWLKTPLVSALTPGRVTYQGTSMNLELRPSGGEAGSGSQISLPAMRLLGAPLTGVIELQVFSN